MRTIPKGRKNRRAKTTAIETVGTEEHCNAKGIV